MLNQKNMNLTLKLQREPQIIRALVMYQRVFHFRSTFLAFVIQIIHLHRTHSKLCRVKAWILEDATQCFIVKKIAHIRNIQKRELMWHGEKMFSSDLDVCNDRWQYTRRQNLMSIRILCSIWQTLLQTSFCLPIARAHHLKTITINFTISNLPYSAEMNYSSAMFNSTESVLQHLVRPSFWKLLVEQTLYTSFIQHFPFCLPPQLRPLFQNNSFNASCRLTSLR